MEYTTLHPAYLQEIVLVEKAVQSGADAVNKLKEEHPTWDITRFSLDVFGIRPYKYQHLLYKHIFSEKKMIICKSRQIGISTGIELASLYSAVYNIFPTGIFNNTKIGIISKTNEQSKKVLLDIKKLMMLGDSRIKSKPFEALLDNSRIVPQNMYQINFKNKCFIKCFPPTDAVRGESFDIVFVDEAAFIEDDEIFFNSILPTVSRTDGRVILASTPNGQQGFFFEIFDPFDRFKTHEYQRYWFWWKHCEDIVQRKIIKQAYNEALEKGTLKNFQQEYEALFTVDEEAFFESSDVDKGVDPMLAIEYSWKDSPCSLAIDYGITKSATTLTVKTKHNGVIKTLFQFAAFDFDENLLMDRGFEHSVYNLYKRYDIKYVIVDDCPQGNRTNKQLENEGFPVIRFNWGRGQHTSDKNKMYYSYRAHLKKGHIKYPNIRELLFEMKALKEVRMKILTSIEKPKSGTDDRVDGEVMASIPFLEDDGNFDSTLVIPKEDPVYAGRKGWRDEQWDYIKAASPDPAFLLKQINSR